jgi:hypothetical protein
MKRSTTASLSDLSSALTRAELKKRGIDPLSVATLRDAFIVYDFHAGSGDNLNSNAEEILKALKDLNTGLGQTSLQSHLSVRTKKPGARVWYRLIGGDDSHQINQLTNRAEDDIPVGFYFVWAERSGRLTSSKTGVFRIIRAKATVDLEETN